MSVLATNGREINEPLMHAVHIWECSREGHKGHAISTQSVGNLNLCLWDWFLHQTRADLTFLSRESAREEVEAIALRLEAISIRLDRNFTKGKRLTFSSRESA